MKKTAEDYLGEEVTEAVITVPAYLTIPSVSNQGRRPYSRLGRKAHYQRTNGCSARVWSG